MRKRLTLALAALAAGLSFTLTGTANPKGPAQLVSSVTLSMASENFGGLSGIEILDNGNALLAVTDRGFLLRADLTRDATGAATGIKNGVLEPLLTPKGKALGKYQGDSEGIALRPDGTFYISFEADHRVWLYDGARTATPTGKPHPDFAGFQNNSGMEGLAADARGYAYALPERSGDLARPFPVYRFDGKTWDQPFALRRDGGYLATGLDFGPDGKLYLLEREFTGLAFKSRVRRFDVTGDRVNSEETILETSPGTHDNLEGISVWRDDAGKTRLTLIADDNFNFFQTSELAEYVLN